MLMDDLGDPIRSPTMAEAAAAACAVHTIPPMPTLHAFGRQTLARLPEQALAALDELHRQGRFLKMGTTEDLLRRLAAVAGRRTDGAERESVGLCHGEFPPPAVTSPVPANRQRVERLGVRPARSIRRSRPANSA
ncbi:hypothetical protein AB0B18_28505 [Micromonospora chalcea]